MIATRDFVFLHMPKTAGRFVRKLLREHAPPDWNLHEDEEHIAVGQLPDAYRSLPVIGVVRNPWDWYVSAYHYSLAHRHIATFNQLSDNGTLGFPDTVRRAQASSLFGSNDVGFYTRYLRYFFSAADFHQASVHWVRFEHLRDDLVAVLDTLLPEGVPDALRQAAQAAPPENVSGHRHYTSYYDAELIELVAERDRPVIDRFTYRFDTTQSKRGA